MNEKIEEEEVNTEEETKEVNDQTGEIEEEENKDKAAEEDVSQEFDDTKIEPEVRADIKQAKEEEEEDEVDPEDKARIEKIVNRQVGSKLTELENKAEVQAFVAAKPEYGKYQGAILKYMSHPAYSNIPVHNIAAIVASKDMMKLGAAKERQTQRDVAETKSPGSTVRKPSGGTTDWFSVPKDDFEAQKAKVLGRVGN